MRPKPPSRTRWVQIAWAIGTDEPPIFQSTTGTSYEVFVKPISFQPGIITVTLAIPFATFLGTRTGP